MLTEIDDVESSGITTLRDALNACKTYFEECGLQPVITIKVENHYHGDIENYNSYGTRS